MPAWSIEASGDGFLLTRSGAHLHIPATAAGIKVLNSVLMKFTEDDKIGQGGFPTQHQLNEMVEKWKKDRPEPQFKIDLSDLGL